MSMVAPMAANVKAGAQYSYTIKHAEIRQSFANMCHT